MNYTQEREEFIATMAIEGLPVYQARRVLALANRLQIIAELSCSSEWHNNVDRVPCPAIRKVGTRRVGKPEDCICSHGGALTDEPEGEHYTVPRIDREEARKQKRLVELLKPYNMTPNFQGDPRGAVVKIAVPSGKYDDLSKEGICVPSKGLPASFWERHAA